MAHETGRSTAGLSPRLLLVATFGAWKLLLLLIAVLSPGTGYDTSTDLLFSLDTNNVAEINKSWTSTVTSKFVRWDAIYFVSLAKHGYVYEQEWAFGWGFAKLIQCATQCMELLRSTSSMLHSPTLSAELSSVVPESLAAIFIANAAHLASTILLYHLCRAIQLELLGVQSLLVAILHIVAPAGIFMSAPYGESLFAALSFAGYLCYVKSVPSKNVGRKSASFFTDSYVVAAGLFFGLSCTVRSNGLFNGVLFAVDLFAMLYKVAQGNITAPAIRRMVALVIAGMAVACGFTFPQYIAWKQHCLPQTHGSNRRPWCDATIPSVYTFVQQHYWNVGFLRYWTVSNLPLFALAMPMLYMSAQSVIWVFTSRSPTSSKQKAQDENHDQRIFLIRRMALPQGIVTVLALTNFHVQIITRISSAYPLIYIWIASLMANNDTTDARSKTRFIVAWSVMYALIQGALFASFLPPA